MLAVSGGSDGEYGSGDCSSTTLTLVGIYGIGWMQLHHPGALATYCVVTSSSGELTCKRVDQAI